MTVSSHASLLVPSSLASSSGSPCLQDTHALQAAHGKEDTQEEERLTRQKHPRMNDRKIVSKEKKNSATSNKLFATSSNALVTSSDALATSSNIVFTP